MNRRIRSILIAASFATLPAPAGLHATTFAWDSDADFSNGATDGSGSWNTSSNWYTGSTDTAWKKGTANSAMASFGTASGNGPYSVTIDGALGAGGLTFNQLGSGAYTLAAGSGTLTLNTAAQIDVINTGGATISAVLAGTNGLSETGAGTLTLSGANTYTGVTTISAGTLSVTAIGNGGAAGNLGQASNAAANLVIAGGTLQYTGATASTDRAFTLGATGGAIDASGSGAITFANTGAVALAGTDTARTFALTGASTADNTFSLSLGDNGAGKIALVKSGVGKWILSSTNGYTGTTSVNGGTLVVNGSIAGSTTTVNSGGTLAGTGTTGAITLNAGAFLAPGTAAGGTLTAGALTWNGGGVMQFNLGTSGALALTGALTKGAAGSYTFDFLGTGVNNGTYTLITSAGLDSAFTAGSFTATNLAAGLTGSFTQSGNNLMLTVTAVPECGYFAGAGALLLLAGLKRRRRI